MSPKKPLLSDNTAVVQRLKRAVEDCTLPHVPQLIRETLETGAWRERYEFGKIIRFDEFAEFITSKKPAGCGWNPETVTVLLRKSEDAEALKLWLRAMHAEAANKIDAQTPDLKDAHRPKKGYTQENDVTVKQRGNSDEYAIAKLRKDRPDIHARVLAGELSPHAGMIEAGFRKKAVRKKLSAFDCIVKQVAKLSDAEWQKLKHDEDRRRTYREAAE